MFNKIVKSSFVLFVFPLVIACSSKVKPAPIPQEVGGQLTFESPQLAVDALKQAVNKNDAESLALLFGPDAKDLLSSGDKVADQDSLKDFSLAIAEKSQIVESKNTDSNGVSKDVAWLLVSKGNFPFPIPIIKDSNRWHFDTVKGKQEIINRRIGQNELSTIRFANEYVSAQLEYYALDRDSNNTHEFAKKFFSSPGKKDGLYWAPVNGEALSPIGPLVATASLDGYQTSTKPQPFHGYYFKILTNQTKNARGGAKDYIRNGKMTEGFALLAYPAEWDNSGAMTFIVGPDGVVYQKNLGADSSNIASKITSFDPDLSWNPV